MNERDLEYLCDGIIARISDIKKQRFAMCANYRENGPDGFRRNGDGAKVKSSGHGDPTASMGIALLSDPLEGAMDSLERALRHCITYSKVADAAAHRLEPVAQMKHDVASDLANAENSNLTVQCINCKRPIEGIEKDRIRNDRCHTCYTYHRRHKGVDRVVTT